MTQKSGENLSKQERNMVKTYQNKREKDVFIINFMGKSNDTFVVTIGGPWGIKNLVKTHKN